MEKSKVEHKKQVLIVDDDPDFADALAEVFQSLGYDVITANSFQDGLRVAREQKPMVAFVDVQLGTERGTGMVPLLLKDNPDMLCLVMTAYTDADTVIEALKAGAYDYLRKPIDLYDVQRTLERSFDVLQLREDNSQAVKNLRDSEQRYRSLVEGIPQGMLIHSNGRPLFVNPEFVRIFGYGSMKEVLELKKLDMLFENPLEVMSLATKTAQLQDSGPGKDESEDMVSAYKGMRKDGSEVWFERFPQPILWEGQAAELVSFLDVSERIKLEEQLRHSQKLDAVGYLASGVAHDFNNLLQIIRGYAELGLKRSGGDEKLVDVMNKVMDAAEKGGSLTRQLLAFSRKEVMKLKSLNLHELTANLVKMLKRIIGEDIELSLIFPDDLPRLQADPGMIEQVLLNLCVNARDAMPDGGRLVIEAEKVVVDQDYRKVNPWAREKHYVQLSVTDTGTGMSPEVLEKVFEPFFTTKKLGRGTGLGLSVAYGIIKQHRGFISVYSEEGLGTTFRIYLPAEFNPREQQEENADDSESEGGSETILVAEDEASLLELLVKLLKGKGYKVITATNGEEAIERFKENKERIHLVLLDVMMPRLKGSEACQKIKEISPETPVIFSTGYSGNAIDKEFLEKFNAKLINKPYTPNVLYWMTRNALDEAAGKVKVGA